MVHNLIPVFQSVFRSLGLYLDISDCEVLAMSLMDVVGIALCSVC